METPGPGTGGATTDKSLDPPIVCGHAPLSIAQAFDIGALTAMYVPNGPWGIKETLGLLEPGKSVVVIPLYGPCATTSSFGATRWQA